MPVPPTVPPTVPPATSSIDTDRAAVTALVAAFFAGFRSGPDAAVRLAALPALFVPGAVVVRTCGDEPRVTDVEAFLGPRRTLLGSGALQDFTEWPQEGRVDVFGDVAHWFGAYGKSWRQDGQELTGRGMKSMQFVRTRAGWRITAAAWDDERPGVGD